MKKQFNLIVRILSLLLFVILILQGCSRNDTLYIPDNRAEGLAIFSNRGNNIMTCYMNDQPWRTYDRTTSGGFGGPTWRFEIRVLIDSSNTTNDTLQLNWEGQFDVDQRLDAEFISAVLVLPKLSSLNELNTMLDGKRISLNNQNGHFTYSRENSLQGTGTILFQTFQLNPDSLGNVGRIAGLFETTVGDSKISNARFDHTLINQNFWY